MKKKKKKNKTAGDGHEEAWDSTYSLSGTLRGRLIISVAAVHAVMMTIFITDLTIRHRAMLLDRQAEQAITLSRALATSATEWIAANDVSGLQELVEAQRSPEILFAVLTDERGRVLAGTDKSRLGHQVLDLPGEAHRTVLSRSSALVDVAFPAMMGGTLVGWARVGIGRKTTGEKLSDITLNGMIYGLAAILFGSVIAWFMGRRITQRLYAVLTTIDKVRAGNRMARSTISGVDEAAVMAREFNSMLDALAERDAELHSSEARFRELFAITPIPLCYVTKEGVIRDFNDRFEQVFGYTHEDIPTVEEWWQLAYPDETYRRGVVRTWYEEVTTAGLGKHDIKPINTG